LKNKYWDKISPRHFLLRLQASRPADSLPPPGDYYE